MGKLIPTQTLPAAYNLAGTIDLSKDRRAVLVLNILGLVLFFISGWLFLRLVILVRPEVFNLGLALSIKNATGLVILLGWIIGITAVMLVIHEAIHSIFFWVFTRCRPKFGFRITYAFAAAPDWYIPRKSYLYVALSPLVLMTITGIAMIFMLPAALLPALWLLVSMNIAGSVGDLMVTLWLLPKSSNTLAQDYGDGVRFYGSD